MSILSKALHKVGKVAEKAAPFVGMIPGVGTIAAGAIGGLGGLAAGDGLKGALKYGALGAAGGLAGGAVKGAMKSGGILGGLKKVGGSIIGQRGSADVIGIGPGGVPLMDQHAGSGILGGLGGLGGLLSGGLKKVGGLDGVLAGASGIAGVNASRNAGKDRDKAMKLVTQAYDEKAPLRKMGLEGMLNEQRPDLSSTFATSGNPFRRVG